MSNPIDNNFEVNNSISNLSFLWLAQFKDGSIICQVDENKKEHRFQEVLDNFDNLISFSLISIDKSKVFTVDLLSGLIYLGIPKIIDCRILKSRNNIRLIYKRIVRVTVGAKDLKTKLIRINYLLGFQYNDGEKNKKVLFQIDEQGNFVVGD